MNIMEPKILKFKPWRGPNEEIVEGRKTKLTLYDDRIEYAIKYKQKIKLKASEEALDASAVETFNFNDEEGFLMKSDIVGIVKYIDTQFNEELEPFTVNFVDICGGGNSITFSVETEEEKNQLYKDLYEWRIRLKE